VTELPGQNEVGPDAVIAKATNGGCSVTVVVAELAWHPLAFVTVTMNVPLF